jgi:hypothetical protein
MRVVISTLLPYPDVAAVPPGEPPVMLAARAMRVLGLTSIAALVRMRESPFRTAGKEGQAFSVNRHCAGDPKKPAPSLL